MATPAGIVFAHVAKQFRLGVRHGSLRDLIPAVARGLLRGRALPRRPEFWALRDVSFELGPGEALGIMGPNGSGKSTVLKLLAGILRPDAGQVTVSGPDGRRPRIGSLIEVVAGFHYELTGRETVYLQGAVLGMRRAEIAHKFDAIVAFAELAPFIDTPVKHYSSGMSARLGFAVAAHLDPDILLIDEVLAVGDIGFQRKAFASLRAAVQQAIPTVVVSHQLHRIAELCDRAILLTRGQVVAAGTPAECIAAYVGADSMAEAAAAAAPLRLHSISAPSPAHVRPGERVRLRLRGEVTEPGAGHSTAVGVRVRSLPREEIVFAAHSGGLGVALPERGAFELEIDVCMNVGTGLYRAQAVAWDLVNQCELARGPATTIAVEDAPGSAGPVWADPRIRLLSP